MKPRTTRRWLCYECGCTCRHRVTRHQTEPRIIVDGWQAQYVKLPSTRLRRCSDCGKLKRHGYLETESSITFAERSPEYQEGYEAGLTPEVYSDDNPYHHRSKKAREWHDGWCDGADKFIENLNAHQPLSKAR